MADSMTRWSDTHDGLEIKPEHADTLMCAQDGSSYMADVYTRADMGCPMHKARSDD
jgi:hypothetical protein